MRVRADVGIVLFAGVAAAFWLSRAVFPAPLPPLVPFPDLAAALPQAPDWFRDLVGESTPQRDAGAAIRDELVMLVAFQWAIIAAGAAGAALLLFRRRVGRWLLLALSLWLLLWHVGSRVEVVARFGWEKSVAAWTLLARSHPAVPVSWGIEVAFSVLTLAWLGRASVARRLGGARAPGPE